MKKPITIQAKLNFVLVGPIDTADGIIIKSSKLSIEVLAFANHIYRQGLQGGMAKDLSATMRQQNIEYLWSKEDLLLGTGGRNGKVLFCWKNEPTSTTGSVAFFAPRVSDFIKYEYEIFLQNSKYQLMTFTDTKSSYPNKYDDIISFEITENKYNPFFEWQISKLLLQCEYPYLDFGNFNELNI